VQPNGPSCRLRRSLSYQHGRDTVIGIGIGTKDGSLCSI
jgi:hypothetical protein